MKKKNGRTLLALLSLALITALCLIPQFTARVTAERGNRGVVISLLYSDIRNRLSDKALSEYLDRYAEAGIRTVSVPEDTVSTLVTRGDIVGLRYHDIRHKYDTESVAIEEALEAVSGIEYNSHVIIVKRQKMIERLDEWLPLYYTDADYAKAGVIDGMAVYVFFDGNAAAYDIPVGYDEDVLSELSERGLDIALVLRAGSHSSTGYIEKMRGLIGEYNVKYLNVKADSYSSDTDKNASTNAEGIATLIKDCGLTLVVTERVDQLSNVECIGYDTIFEAADGHIMRSYETYDVTQADPTGYMFRCRQYMNSVTDRNIRFLTVTQLSLGGKSNERLASDTLAAVKLTAEKLDSIGYAVGDGSVSFDYDRGTYVPALAASFTAICGMAVLAVVFGLSGGKYMAISVILAAASFGGTFFVPKAVRLLYPTALALVVPCLAVALALLFARRARKTCGTVTLAAGVAGIMLSTVAVGGFVMAALTSGLGYYINNDIFRGIKLSLYAPLIFALLAYYFMFVYRRGSLVGDIGLALSAVVRVWWIILLSAIGVVSFIYIVRSGNVNSISSIEEAMRNFISDHMTARPRTKEFLAAYPCVVLFAAYCKEARGGARGTLTPWLFAVGAAILPASVMNTFCHVFTDVGVQYGRLLWGLLLGVVTGALVLVINGIFLKLCEKIRTMKL